jgi:hypothetical protein
MSMLSTTVALAFLARIKPEIYDALIPHVPSITENSRNMMASAVLKSIAEKVEDADIAKELHQLGKSLFEDGIKEVSYDDSIYPWPYPKPHYLDELFNFGLPVPWVFGPYPEPWILHSGKEKVMLNPQPLPPHEQSYYGALLTILADAISLVSVAETLRNIGYSLIKQKAGVMEKYPA